MSIKRILATLTGSAVMALGAPLSAMAASTTVYDAIPSTFPPNVVSLGFEATSTSEFGDSVHLGGSQRHLSSVTVTMSDWAKYSDFSSDARYSANSNTWSHQITLNVYSNHLGENGALDTVLATKTQAVNIPWRPAGDASCPDTGYGAGFAYKVDGQCYNGKAFNATFDLSSPSITLPNDVIVGVAFNTADYGAAPIHQAGPYNSLNVGIPTGQTASIGSDDNVDNVFWNTSSAGFYTDGGAGGTGTFRQDTHWTPNGTVALKIEATTMSTASDKDQCKNNGYTHFVDENGNIFKNQGQCVSYTNHH